MAGRISAAAFDLGLLVETAGPASEVVKLLPPLIVPEEVVDDAFERLDAACDAVTDGVGNVSKAAS